MKAQYERWCWCRIDGCLPEVNVMMLLVMSYWWVFTICECDDDVGLLVMSYWWVFTRCESDDDVVDVVLMSVTRCECDDDASDVVLMGVYKMWMWWCRSLEDHIGLFKVPGFDSYPDFLAMGLLLLATILVAIGVKVSTEFWNSLPFCLPLYLSVCLLFCSSVCACLSACLPV